MKRHTGYAKTVLRKRNFGFVRAENGKEYFFHRAGFIGDFDELREGQKLEFSLMQDDKNRSGIKAVAVRLADESLPSYEAVIS